MRKNFIDCRIFYPNLNKASKQHKKIVYKNSNRFEKNGLYLPSGPSQSLNNLNKVVELIKKFYNH
jgi:dTDP-4-amino-4,6-dideoxygalactose transaminase